MMEWNIYKEKFENGLNPIISWLNEEYDNIRCGRISVNFFDKIVVDAYDEKLPLKQVANVLILDARNVSIKPYDVSIIKQIMTAITNSNLGVNPQLNVNEIKISFPPITEESRKNNVKRCKELLEKAKVYVRGVRQEVQNLYKKQKDISEDLIYHYEEELNKITKLSNTKLEEIFNKKQVELLKI